MFVVLRLLIESLHYFVLSIMSYCIFHLLFSTIHIASNFAFWNILCCIVVICFAIGFNVFHNIDDFIEMILLQINSECVEVILVEMEHVPITVCPMHARVFLGLVVAIVKSVRWGIISIGWQSICSLKNNESESILRFICTTKCINSNVFAWQSLLYLTKKIVCCKNYFQSILYYKSIMLKKGLELPL